MRDEAAEEVVATELQQGAEEGKLRLEAFHRIDFPERTAREEMINGNLSDVFRGQAYLRYVFLGFFFSELHDGVEVHHQIITVRVRPLRHFLCHFIGDGDFPCIQETTRGRPDIRIDHDELLQVL